MLIKCLIFLKKFVDFVVFLHWNLHKKTTFKFCKVV